MQINILKIFGLLMDLISILTQTEEHKPKNYFTVCAYYSKAHYRFRTFKPVNEKLRSKRKQDCLALVYIVLIHILFVVSKKEMLKILILFITRWLILCRIF